MAETHKVKLIYSTKEEIILTDDEPLRSAVMFKYISDKIIEQRPPKQHKLAYWGIESAMALGEAYQAANDVAASIDERLVVVNGDTNLGKVHAKDHDVIIPAGLLDEPEAAWVETFNWDAGMRGRQIDIDGQRHYAQFTDKHRDYYRELAATFRFQNGGAIYTTSYVMQRTQYMQDQQVDLLSKVSYSGFAETGYEGNFLHEVELTEEQELSILKVIARMGGIALDGFDS